MLFGTRRLNASWLAAWTVLLFCQIAYLGGQQYPQDPQDFIERISVADFTTIPREPFPINKNRKTVPAEEAPLGDLDLVVGVVYQGESRAYPLNFLIGPANEIVNDSVAGLEITVTWCLVNRSAVVFSRSVDGQLLDFGVRGISKGTQLMYDKQTLSHWSQLTGEAVQGPQQGKRLQKLHSLLTTWEHWRSIKPETSVYVNWAVSHFGGLTCRALADMVPADPGPLRPEDLVVGIDLGAEQKAYPLRPNRAEDIVINDTVGQLSVLIFVASDYSVIACGIRSLGNRVLTFALDQDDHLVDEQTNSIWDPITLQCLSGKLEGQRLEPLTATSSLWNGWSREFPGTVLFTRTRP